MISILPVEGLPEVGEGDDLAALVAERVALETGDVVVLAQKVVSKVEGRVVRLDEIEPSARAVEAAGDERDPRELEAILSEAKRIVRERGPLLICETRHGFVCASAGVDHSNAPEGTLVLLPVDPDASARAVRERLRELTGADVGVVITDSFGRPFRHGTTDVAIGVAGIPALVDLRGSTDRHGRELLSTRVAVADEIAAAANLVRSGKADGVPAVILRGLSLEGDGAATELVIDAGLDLFR